jgi:SulP family sulfate permease
MACTPGSITVSVGSLFSSSTMMMITATNALALVTAEKLGALGPDVDPAAALATLTLLVGVVMAALGLLKLGSVVRFISAEVQAGMVAAVALLILLGQFDDLVGCSSHVDGNKVRKAFDITLHIGDWSLPTVAVSLGCIVTLVLAKRTPCGHTPTSSRWCWAPSRWRPSISPASRR